MNGDDAPAHAARRARERLPDRRGAIIRDIAWPPEAWKPAQLTVSLGRYADGRPAEIFVDPRHMAEEAAALLRDGAILASLALQYGAPLATLAAALNRDEQGRPASLIGVAIEAAGEMARGDRPPAPAVDGDTTT